MTSLPTNITTSHHPKHLLTIRSPTVRLTISPIRSVSISSMSVSPTHMLLIIGVGSVGAKTVSFAHSMQVPAVSTSALTTQEITANLRIALMMREERKISTFRWFSLGPISRCEDRQVYRNVECRCKTNRLSVFQYPFSSYVILPSITCKNLHLSPRVHFPFLKSRQAYGFFLGGTSRPGGMGEREIISSIVSTGTGEQGCDELPLSMISGCRGSS